VTATGDTIARAQVVAKYLSLFGRTDIPIGVGVANDNKTYTPLYAWAADTNLTSCVAVVLGDGSLAVLFTVLVRDRYTGKVYMDGVGAMIDVIRNSPAPVSIIAIAPATNFPSLLSRAPDVVSNAAIYAMSGSIHRGYSNSTTPSAEYNVAVCPDCTQLMYAAGWPVFTTPLDTCGTVCINHLSCCTLHAIHCQSSITRVSVCRSSSLAAITTRSCPPKSP
jgi:inosine-uridine nucleoside N-ribohydrolase